MLFNLQAVQESFNQNKTEELKEDIKQVSRLNLSIEICECELRSVKI